MLVKGKSIMHIYAFGSICRGEMTDTSDIDVLVCHAQHENINFSDKEFSIYSYEKLAYLWKEGNPFAWHLFTESKLIYSNDDSDYIYNLGEPAQYRNIKNDLKKFKELFNTSSSEINQENINITFNLSCIFLAIRNIATCYSLFMGTPCFSRNSALKIRPKLSISNSAFITLENARILTTRGIGTNITSSQIDEVKSQLDYIIDWINNIEERINER
ncbi:nucleotidyltransferase domain-containing protein [Actinobacillus equuli subsp. haemolyticus]|uniref:nucleotidyltransferase domain-containing protein n=1 Tax=Actinobacillus equuli TaxID=718 RepID=UPI002441CBFF|nr:nucleotidyltransferase domain-containing protein [Actinobacillus equuli]WGE72358.1 nucleotidyltransferase domain-containing protein [Actinobacillus equuli subsp. haemolyticus]